MDYLKQKFPIHWAVWENDLSSLKRAMPAASNSSHKIKLEEQDPRGRTPLALAVTLGHYDCVRFLLEHNANVNVEDKQGFNVLHESITSGDSELVKEVLERRDYQRYSSRIDGVPALLQKIRDTPDFYLEMKWEFTSWVPLVSRMCPSDIYKIYKSGSSVRIDTTLLGFDQTSWQRGSRSFIFKGNEEGAVFMEVDHDLRQVHVETMKVLLPDAEETVHLLKPPPEVVHARMTSPMSTTYLDTEKISFERSKAGIIGFRSDRTDVVNDHECRVFTANNVEVVTKMRTEHLSVEDKERYKAATASRLGPLQSILGMVETEENNVNVEQSTSSRPASPAPNSRNPKKITAEEYFDETVDLGGRDIGCPRDVTTKTQKFKANLWLCEDYPLSLPEQVLPIVDLMAISSSHFAKLRDFITLQIPSGFPVKIEIPLFHVLNARITFGNIFSLDEAVTGVTPICDDNTKACVVDENVFKTPPGYRILGSDEQGDRQWAGANDEDEIMQMAIQQCLMEDGSDADQVTLWEALRTQQPDTDLQRAIQESLEEYRRSHPDQSPTSFSQQFTNESPSHHPPHSSVAMIDGQPVHTFGNGFIPRDTASALPSIPPSTEFSTDLEEAIRISQKEKEDEEKARLREEQIFQEQLEQILRLSMTEK